MEVAKSSAEGGAWILAGNLVSAGCTAATIVYLARLFGPAGYGLFALGIIVATIMSLFAGFGVRVSVTRLVAHALARRDTEAAKEATVAAMVFIIGTGVALSGVEFGLAGPLSRWILQRPALVGEVQLFSIMVLGLTLVQTAVGVSIAWGRARIAALTDILQGLGMIIMTVILPRAGLGETGAILGYAGSYILGGGIGIFWILSSRETRRYPGTRPLLRKMAELIRLGVPASIGSSFNQLSNYIVPLVLAATAANFLVGQYQAASNVMLSVSVLMNSAMPALFPAFASLDGKRKDLGIAFRMSVKYLSYIVVGGVFLLASSAREIMLLLYGPSFGQGTTYLVLLCVTLTPVLLGFNTVLAFFNGTGKTRLTMYVLLADSAVLFLLAPLFGIVLRRGIGTLIASIFLSNLASAVIGLSLVDRVYGIKLDVVGQAKILAAALGGYLVAYAIPSTGVIVLDLVVHIAVFCFTFLTLTPILRALRHDEVTMVAALLNGIPLVSQVTTPFTRYLRWLANKLEAPPGDRQ